MHDHRSPLLAPLTALRRLRRVGFARAATLAGTVATLALASSTLAQLPQGHGNWKIDVRFVGNAHYEATGAPGTDQHYVNPPPNNIVPTPAGVSMEPLRNASGPLDTVTGGLSGRLQILGDQFLFTTDACTGYHWTPSATMRFILTWQPTNNDPVNDPPPNLVWYMYRRSIYCQSGAQASGGATATASINVIVAGQALGHMVQTSPPSLPPPAYHTDPQWSLGCSAVSAGTAYADFPVSWSALTQLSRPSGSCDGHVRATLGIDLAVLGADWSRARLLPAVSGGCAVAGSDPSYTRWLPLAFSPVVTTQPFRVRPGALPAPWGNVACMYAIQVVAEDLTPPSRAPTTTSRLRGPVTDRPPRPTVSSIRRRHRTRRLGTPAAGSPSSS